MNQNQTLKVMWTVLAHGTDEPESDIESNVDNVDSSGSSSTSESHDDVTGLVSQ